MTAELRDEGRSGTGGAAAPEVAVVAVGVAAEVVVDGAVVGAGIEASCDDGKKSACEGGERMGVAATTTTPKNKRGDSECAEMTYLRRQRQLVPRAWGAKPWWEQSNSYGITKRNW